MAVNLTPGAVDAALIAATATALTNSTGGTASTTLAAGTNITALTGTLTGTLDNILADVAAAAGACAGGATPTATQVDTAIATAAAGLAEDANKNFKEIQHELTAQVALNTVLLNSVTSLGAMVNKLTVDVGLMRAALVANGWGKLA